VRSDFTTTFSFASHSLTFLPPGVDSDAANRLVDLIRGQFVGEDLSSLSVGGGSSDLNLVSAEEFS
jgi:hypothetical protein